MMRLITVRQTLIIAALLSVSASSSAQQAPADNANSNAANLGAISGRVVTGGGEPLTGAIVYATLIGASSQQRTIAVDAGGSFKLDGLDAGSYTVWANAPGFISESPNSNAPWVSTNEPRRYFHTGDSVTLTLIKGGVITGTVTNATNTPVINATVRAFRVRDANGQPVQGVAQARERITDDRGIYRIYGLAPGVYVISAGGPGRFMGFFGSQYDGDVPTYAPSSTRDTASEILVRGGDEAIADIQYRGEPGHSVSGALLGVAPASSSLYVGASITLTEVRTRAVIMSAQASPFNNYGFAFFAIADGEYEVFAQRYSPTGDSAASEPKRIKVQGADLSGINLTLNPLAAIAGRLVLESTPKMDCVKRRTSAAVETVLGARRLSQDAKPPARPAAKGQAATTEVPLSFVNQNVDSVADAKGDFIFRSLHAGVYRIEAQLPGPGWYLRSIAIGTPPQPPKPSDPNIPRDGLSLKSGEKVSGLAVTITEGAASLRGRISAGEGQRVPPGLRVYLVPAERESTENVLRFFEAAPDADATFAINNIAPGRYWLIARAADEGDPARVKPIRQEAPLRAKVLHEAEALKKEISFKQCEQSSDYELPWTSPSRP